MRERTDLSILVVGHTDATGSFDYNLGLSRRRAEAVVNRLVQLGIEQRRLYPVGVGLSAPVASNTTEEGRAKNRRVELVDLAGGRIPWGRVSEFWLRASIAETLDTAAAAN